MENKYQKRYVGSMELRHDHYRMEDLQAEIDGFIKKQKVKITEVTLTPEATYSEEPEGYITVTFYRSETEKEYQDRLIYEAAVAKQQQEAQIKALERATKEKKALYLRLKKEFET